MIIIKSSIKKINITIIYVHMNIKKIIKITKKFKNTKN